MSIFQRIYYFFSQYVGPAERRVGRFFARVSETHSTHKIEKALIDLLQRDIAVVNLWTEQQYKGYEYLTKRTRKQLYDNLASIRQDFSAFAAAQTVDTDPLVKELAGKGANAAMLRMMSDRLRYIVCIMRYLAPKNGRYVYRESSSFGRLLRNPTKEVLEGDCNQIVTLYVALYALRYNVTDLQLTLFPGHVALHFCGIDIETTNGQFAHYDKEGQRHVPIHEIVSVNLLDTTDINYQKGAVRPEVFLQSARLAYVVSSHRSLVKQNLEAAYQNTVRAMIKSQRHQEALDYARQSKSFELIEVAAQNGASAAASRHDFVAARRFAGYSKRKQEIIAVINRNEAAYLFNAQRYQEAIALFERLKDADMVRRCYRGLYVQQQARLGGLKTVADIKAQAGTIRLMEKYARASGDRELTRHAATLTKYL